MSQNDMSVANASGATVRADINSALQALASLSSGGSAPATTYANQIWHDDTNDLLKMRDEANTSWVTIGSMVGTTWTPYWQGSAQGNMSTLTYSAIAQALIMSAKQIETAKATVATATTPNLSTAAANAIEFTGTTTMTGFTLGQAGTLYYCEYTGAGAQINHNATSCILPGAANITIATGDSWFIMSRGSNNGRIFGYQRANGTAIAGGTAATQAEMEAISSTTVFASPGRTQYHPGVAKVTGNFDWAGGTNMSYNVTSTTDAGIGRVGVTIAADFSTANWDCNVDTEYTAAQSPIYNSQAAGTVELRNYDSAGTIFDVTDISFTGMGDQ